ncbi:MAG: molybdenum cofactor guanylyltransferase [Bacteroidota bacterium]
MMGKGQKITGILLSGGKSKRMGREKGQIRIGNRLLYQFPLKVLEEVCDEIVISTCKDFSPSFGHTLVCDEIQDIGPMGGIYSCLKRSSNDLNIVLSYDMPMINRGLLNKLITESIDFDITVPALENGHPEPLCGIYRKGVADKFHELIREDRFAVHQVFPMVKTRMVRIEDTMTFYHPELFLNVNNAADLAKLPRGFGEH